MTSYTCQVRSYQNINTVVTYHIETDIRLYDYTVSSHAANRRYTEFNELYNLVQQLKIIPHNRLPRFPSKSIRNTTQIFEQRRKAFDELCQVLALYPEVMGVDEVKLFLQLPPYDVFNDKKTQVVATCSWDGGILTFFQEGNIAVRALKKVMGLGSTRKNILCHDQTNVLASETPLVVIRRFDCIHVHAVLDIISQLRKLEHENIVPIHDVFWLKGTETIYTLRPYCKHGNLKGMINITSPMEEQTIVDVFLQLTDALSFLHGQTTPIVHKQLTSQDIMVTWMIDTGALKVALSSFDLVQSTTVLGIRGQFNTLYQAPEAERNYAYSTMSDVWSLGVIIFELMTFCPGIVDHERGKQVIPLSKFLKDSHSEANVHRVLRQKMRTAGYRNKLIEIVIGMLKFAPWERLLMHDIRTELQTILFSSIPTVRPVTSELFCYGVNSHAELGVGHKLRIVKPSRHITRLTQREVRKIVIGDGFTFFLTTSDVYAVGKNNYGQLGIGEKADHIGIPTKIQKLCGVNIVDMSAGTASVLALTSEGKVYGWGKNDRHQLLLGHNQRCDTPVPITLLAQYTIKNVYSSDDFFMILTDDDTSTCLLAWGENKNQQLGIGLYTNEYEVEPKQVKITKHVSKVTLGKDFCIIIDDDRRMYSHGCGQFGQLGHGNTDNKSVPTVVEKIQAYRVSQVAVGDHNVFALTSTVLCQFCNMVVDGSVFGWGANQSCQVGAGQSSLYISEPIILRAFNDIRLYKISCGSQHAMAIVDDGGIYAWGKLASNRIQEEPQEVQNFKDNAWDIVSGYDSTFIFCE